MGCIAAVAVIYDLNANTLTVTISITQNCMIGYATINYEMFFCFVTVKEFLAQAKEEFQKKWDHPPPVSSFFFIVFFQEIKVNKTNF